MTELVAPDKVVALDQALASAGIDHAFGGALALAYYAEPRATIDIDVNLFVPGRVYGNVVEVLRPLGVDAPSELPALDRDAQARLAWGRTPLDLFFVYDEVHDAMRDARRLVPFGDGTIPVLSPEHLVLCKVIFNRGKDWLDIAQVLVVVEELDLAEVRGWLDARRRTRRSPAAPLRRPRCGASSGSRNEVRRSLAA